MEQKNTEELSTYKQGQYSPRKRKDTTPKVNPQLAVELVFQELKRVEVYTKRIENSMEKGCLLDKSIKDLTEELKKEVKGREELYKLKRGMFFTQILLVVALASLAIYIIFYL